MKNKIVFTIAIFGLLLFGAMLCLPSHSQAWPYGKPKKFAALFSLGGWYKEYSERLEIAVWIPGIKPEVHTEFEGSPMLRFGGKVPEPTYRYPLILISHDSVGNRLSLYDLAEELAREGFVVAAPTHCGDNIDDMSKSFTFDALLGRPRQLVLTLETLLNSPDFYRYIDPQRIGVIGVGVGAASALQLGGATPNADGWSGYCADAAPGDSYCQPVIKQLIDKLSNDMRVFQASDLGFLLTPPLHSSDFTQPQLLFPEFTTKPAPAAKTAEAKDKRAGKKQKNKTNAANLPQAPTAEQQASKLAAQLAAKSDGTGRNATSAAPFAQSLTSVLPKAPRYIKSLLLIAPGNSFFFTPDSLKRDLPVAVFGAENDELYPIEKHALPLSGILPGMPYQIIFNKADHYSLLTPLPRKLTETLPELAGSASPNEREKILKKRNAEAVLFFKATLGAPVALPPPPQPVIDPQ